MSKKMSKKNEHALSSTELEELVAECIPDMEARVEGLRMCWPGVDVNAALNRNESLLRRLKVAVAGARRSVCR